MEPAIFPQKMLTLAIIEQARRSGIKIYSDGSVVTLSRSKPNKPGWYQINTAVKTEPEAA